MKKKSAKRLGKGLEALFNQSELNALETASSTSSKQTTTKNGTAEHFSQLRLSAIHPNPEQPRTYFDKEKITELAKSLKQVGVVEPIVVIKADQQEGYLLIAGERRWRAAREAGFETIPAVIKNQTRDELLELMLIENIQREDLSALEEATSYEVLLKKRRLTQEQLAERLGKSRSHITNLLRLLKLPLETKTQLSERQLSAGHAKVLVALPQETIKKLTRRIVKEKLSVRQVEKLALLEKRKAAPRPVVASNAHREKNGLELEEVEQLLREALHTKVKVAPLKKKAGRKVGKIEIEYYSLEALEQLLKKLC